MANDSHYRDPVTGKFFAKPPWLNIYDSVSGTNAAITRWARTGLINTRRHIRERGYYNFKRIAPNKPTSPPEAAVALKRVLLADVKIRRGQDA